MPLQQLGAPLDPARGHPGRDIILEALAEGAALAAVKRQHRLILMQAGERGADGGRRHAGRLSLAGKRGEEALEAAATGRRLGGLGKPGDKQKSERQADFARHGRDYSAPARRRVEQRPWEYSRRSWAVTYRTSTNDRAGACWHHFIDVPPRSPRTAAPPRAA